MRHLLSPAPPEAATGFVEYRQFLRTSEFDRNSGNRHELVVKLQHAPAKVRSGNHHMYCQRALAEELPLASKVLRVVAARSVGTATRSLNRFLAAPVSV